MDEYELIVKDPGSAGGVHRPPPVSLPGATDTRNIEDGIVELRLSRDDAATLAAASEAGPITLRVVAPDDK
jgi:hypothetical protein